MRWWRATHATGRENGWRSATGYSPPNLFRSFVGIIQGIKKRMSDGKTHQQSCGQPTVEKVAMLAERMVGSAQAKAPPIDGEEDVGSLI